jgi:hypothetical protein
MRAGSAILPIEKELYNQLIIIAEWYNKICILYCGAAE